MSQSGVNLRLEQMGFYPLEEMLATEHHHRQITIGIPRETVLDEHRIALTPQGVESLTEAGHRILLESMAGMGANYSDLDYSEAGGRITTDREEVFRTSDLILKVSPLSRQEIEWLKPGQTIVSSFNLMSNSSEVLQLMLSKKINAIGFEFLRGENNHLPVVSAMSEIAGLASITIAAEYLSNAHGGKGILLGGVSGVSPTEVAILGTGTAAEFAARAALGLGARVRILGSSPYRLRRMQHHLRQPIFTSITQQRVLAKALTTADVVIGAVDMSDADNAILVSSDMVRGMKPGSVIIDISIDQGGCFETSRLTTHSHPVFREYDIVHYGVANIASRVSRTASIALSNIFAPILRDIGRAGGVKQMLKTDIGLRRGTYIYQGILTNSYIGSRFGLPSQHIDLLMAAL